MAVAKKTVKVALDWTPNTIHSGLYVAVEKGFYANHGLDVHLLPPDDTYSTTPARRLSEGEVDLAICPSESCIAYHESGRMKLQAIYAILQRDASAIVSTRFSDLRELAGGTYGSYNARYEDAIVRSMVSAAGGDGEAMKIRSATGKLSLFDTMRKGDGQIDATWVFLPWEGVEAELNANNNNNDGTRLLHAFRTEDYGVPYGYSPVIARDAGKDDDTGLPHKVLHAFVAATREGYEHAQRHPQDAVAVLQPLCRPERSEEFLWLSQQRINEYYGDGSARLGSMESARWSAWLGWLRQQRLLLKTEEELGSDEVWMNV